MILSKLAVMLPLCIMLASPVSLTNEDDENVTDWNDITIDQMSVGHERGCTICSLQIIVQSSRTLDEDLQLEEGYTLSEYLHFDSISQSYGLGFGDAWSPDGLIAFSDKYCNGTFSWADLGSAGKMKGNYCVGLWCKDFKDMSYSEQLEAMRYLWENGYYVAVGVEYKGVDQKSNGVSGYEGAHATVLAGVDDTTIWLNDPATGTIRDYSKCSAKGGDYNIMYCLVYKNSETAPYLMTDSLDDKLNVIGFYVAPN